MKPIDLIFQAVSNMTDGIINDITTAIIGCVTLLFLIVGFKHLQNVLIGKKYDKYISDRNLGSEYEDYKNKQIFRAKFKHDFEDL